LEESLAEQRFLLLFLEKEEDKSHMVKKRLIGLVGKQLRSVINFLGGSNGAQRSVLPPVEVQSLN
jgi:hypothetical protein